MTAMYQLNKSLQEKRQSKMTNIGAMFSRLVSQIFSVSYFAAPNRNGRQRRGQTNNSIDIITLVAITIIAGIITAPAYSSLHLSPRTHHAITMTKFELTDSAATKISLWLTVASTIICVLELAHVFYVKILDIWRCEFLLPCCFLHRSC